MAIKYNIEKHAVVGVGRLLTANGGAHIYDILAGADRDNGSIVGLGEYIAPFYHAETDATAFTGEIVDILGNGNYLIQVKEATNAWLVATSPLIYEEYTQSFQDEANFYNEKGDKMTCHELKVYDEFEVSALGISGEPTIGATVTVTGKKITVSA